MTLLTKNARFILLGTGLLGLIAVFVFPLAEIGSGKKAEIFTTWQIRKAHTGLAYITVLGFLSAALIGGFAAARGTLETTNASFAAVASATGVVYFVQDFARSPMWEHKSWALWSIAFLGLLGGLTAAVKAFRGNDD